MTLTPVGGQPLKACVLGNNLLPDDPLRPGTTYLAHAMWTPSPQTPAQPLSWQFSTTTDQANPYDNPGGNDIKKPTTNPGGCHPKLSLVSATLRQPTQIAVRVHACGKSIVTVGIYSTRHKTARQRRALITRTVTVRRAGDLTVRVPSGKLHIGQVALRATLGTVAARAKMLTSTVTIKAAA